MDPIDDLLAVELYALAATLAPLDIPLIVGGGYGLLLRQRFIRDRGLTTVRPVPEARATQDIDVFLTTEILVDGERMRWLRDVLLDRGYRSVKGAEHYQFERAVPFGVGMRILRVDLLAPLPDDPDILGKLKVKDRRVRHRKTEGIHAHATPEAFSVGDKLLSLSLGSPTESVEVYLPHSFSFLLLKLFAFRDRLNDSNKEYGRYHAFDLYRIIAMMTENDFTAAALLRNDYSDHQIVIEAGAIVRELFAGIGSDGVDSVLEHARRAGTEIGRKDVDAFVKDLWEIVRPGEVASIPLKET